MQAVRPWMLGALLAAPLFAHAQDYFQQQVDYRITVRLNDSTHELFANEEFDYTREGVLEDLGLTASALVRGGRARTRRGRRHRR